MYVYIWRSLIYFCCKGFMGHWMGNRSHIHLPWMYLFKGKELYLPYLQGPSLLLIHYCCINRGGITNHTGVESSVCARWVYNYIMWFCLRNAYGDFGRLAQHSIPVQAFAWKVWLVWTFFCKRYKSTSNFIPRSIAFTSTECFETHSFSFLKSLHECTTSNLSVAFW